LFRVAQEALANIWHHSGSRRAHLRLARANSRELLLTVEDYGVGIAGGTGRARGSGNGRGPGIGLASMRERLDQIGGRLKIDSVPGRTIVGAVVPIDSGAATSS